MSTIATTKGLSLSTRCLFLSQDICERAVCEVIGAGPIPPTMIVRATVDGLAAMYYPDVKTLASTYEGDCVLVEVSSDKWEPRIVAKDEVEPSATTAPVVTQLDRVNAGFAKLYRNALDEDARNEVRVAMNDSSDDATDDGSIGHEMWHAFNDHHEAFEDVQDTHAGMVATAQRPTMPEKKG